MPEILERRAVISGAGQSDGQPWQPGHTQARQCRQAGYTEPGQTWQGRHADGADEGQCRQCGTTNDGQAADQTG